MQARTLITAAALLAAPAALAAQPNVVLAGSGGGAPFEDRCDVAELRVHAGYWIDGVQLACRDGRVLPHRGGTGGTRHVFRLEPGERITGLSGTALGPYGDYVYSLQVHTDRRSSPVYGNGGPEQGRTPFRFDVPGGSALAGLTGRAGEFLHAVGIVHAAVRPLERLGPVGGAQGAAFADDACQVAGVVVHAGYWIDGLRTVCRDGRELPHRGGTGGNRHVFRLEPGEWITGVSGSAYGPGGQYVYSLQIHTNRRSSPVYGNGGPEKGLRAFRFEVPQRAAFAGFFGRAGEFVHALGIQVER